MVDDFLDFIRNKRLIIHNAEFDLSHLNNELILLGKKKISSDDTVDTLSLARDKFPGSPVSLDALCKRYRIDNSNRTQHTALVDCDLLSKVYINLLDQKEPTLNYENQDNEKTKIKSINSSQYYKKVIKPSEEEFKSHKDYLKSSLKKNFFN